MARSRTSDLRIWAEYTQTVPKLLPGRARLDVTPAPALAASPPAPAPPAASSLALAGAPAGLALAGVPAGLTLAGVPAGLDRGTWKRFSSARMPVEARLDLHGMTATRAHHAVSGFIARNHAAQTRCVEIITGKGEVLARELPHWLNAPAMRPMILALAHPHAANTGSVKILLRRIRPSFCEQKEAKKL